MIIDLDDFRILDKAFDFEDRIGCEFISLSSSEGSNYTQSIEGGLIGITRKCMNENEEIKFILDNLIPNRDSQDEANFAQTYRKMTSEERSKFIEEFQAALDYASKNPISDEHRKKIRKAREIAKRYE